MWFNILLKVVGWFQVEPSCVQNGEQAGTFNAIAYSRAILTYNTPDFAGYV